MGDLSANKIFTFYNEVPVPETIIPFVSPNEKICFAAKTIKGVAIFTDKRILVADKQGLKAKKTEYYTIPFKNILTYVIETSGRLDLESDSEIKLVLSGGICIEFRFIKDENIDELLLKVYHLINNYIIG